MSAALSNAVLVTDLPAPGDAELVERFLVARDQTAFAELVRRHSQTVLGVGRRVLHDANDVDDVFQATFLVFVRDAARVRKRRSLASWLYGVAYRLSLRVARQKRCRREAVLLDQTAVGEGIFEELARRHDEQLLDAELNALPDRYRQPLVLRYLTGKSPQEIADELGMTVGAVDGLLKRGKYELRRRLLQRGIRLGAALVVLQLTQQAVQAAGTEALIEATIQVGLAGGLGSNTLLANSVSNRAVELAGKEIIAMTTSTKAALAVGLTVGGLVVGLGGINLLSGPAHQNAQAAGLVTTLSTGQVASQRMEMAAITADPEVKSNIARPETPAPTPDSKTVAQQVGPESSSWFVNTKSPPEQKIEKELLSPAEVAFNDIPLNDALRFVESTHHIKILNDARSLYDEGISTDTPVTLNLAGTSLRSVLRLLLEPLSLDYIIQNDALTITTISKAASTFETRVYNIDRLKVTPKELAEVIIATVEPGSWNTDEPAPQRPKPEIKLDDRQNGAAIPSVRLIPVQFVTGAVAGDQGAKNAAVDPLKGTIRTLKNTLVIRQTQRIHEEIVKLLNQFERPLDQFEQPSGM